MADGEWKSGSWKKEEDHSKETTELLEKINATTVAVLLRSSAEPLEHYLQQLLAMEKKARFGSDTISTGKLATEVVRVARLHGTQELMLQHADTLMKKRFQMKQVQTHIVEEVAQALEKEGLARDARRELLERLKFLTEGKIHVELQHARHTAALARMCVEDGRLREASDMLLAVQIETITNMPRLEKIDSILNQLSLALQLKDTARVQMLSRKLNHRALGKADTKAEKCEYFHLMLEHYSRQENHFIMARCWHELYLNAPDPDEPVSAAAAAAEETKSLPPERQKYKAKYAATKKYDALSKCILLAVLAPHSSKKEIEDAAECTAFSPESMQTDRTAWLQVLRDNRHVKQELPGMEKLLTAFNGVELIRTSFAPEVAQLGETHPMLTGQPQRLEAFYSRLSEHDILIAAKFYKSVRLDRLAALVGLSTEATETFIMSMVTTKTIYAKIDRIDGVVVFERKRNPVDVAQDWNRGVEKVAGLIDRTVHLVSKERMLHAVV